MLFASVSYGQEEPLNVLKDTALSYFRPLSGTVTAVLVGSDGLRVISDLGESSGIKKGMRLTVKRSSGTFLHPLTRLPLGKAETPIGRAEVIETSSDGSVLRVLAGEAGIGDVLRVSSARVVVLYSESVGVDWFLSDEYYRRLYETDRFELIDTAPVLNDREVIERAKGEGAEVAVLLSSEDSMLRQRLLWTEDAKEFASTVVRLEEAFISGLRLGEELFFPRRDR